MPQFNPTVALMRFGTALSPSHSPPQSPHDLLLGLPRPSQETKQLPVYGMTGVAGTANELKRLRALLKAGQISEADSKAFNNQYRQFTFQKHTEDYAITLARGIASPYGFRERLVWFWADHFAVAGKGLILRHRVNGFIEQAIRPNIAGNFADLLQAATLHPVMITYLDQNQSVGPNSVAAQKNPKRGLNENLAREILELHTLGVQAGYNQQDVRTFAKLLAGISINPQQEAVFNKRLQEPGPLSLLGFETTGDANREADIHGFLADIAKRPATAQHLAYKLAQHFLMDEPPNNMVRKMAKAYLANSGSLMAMYEVMLDYPLAMSPTLFKVKRPIEYMVSALRAFDVKPEALVASAKQDTKAFTREMLNPMARMGQRWGQPGGPNGWPKTSAEWVSPNTISERMRWALRVQTRQFINPLEPEEMLDNGLGPLADDKVRWAVKAAETKKEAIALMLMSPAFQRH